MEIVKIMENPFKTSTGLIPEQLLQNREAELKSGSFFNI